jgi:hypothetical protein
MYNDALQVFDEAGVCSQMDTLGWRRQHNPSQQVEQRIEKYQKATVSMILQRSLTDIYKRACCATWCDAIAAALSIVRNLLFLTLSLLRC